MLVTVIHNAFEDTPITVAEIDAGSRTEDDALEYAYRVTQNLEGSWSKGPTIEWDGEVHKNGDYNDDITVVAPLHEGQDGKVYGLRSTSVGDVLQIGRRQYEVAAFGWNELNVAI